MVATVGEGELDARYQQDSEAQHIEAELDALDVGQLGLGSFVGVPLKGARPYPRLHARDRSGQDRRHARPEDRGAQDRRRQGEAQLPGCAAG